MPRPEAKQGNVPSDYSEVCEAEDRLVSHTCKLSNTQPPLPPQYSCDSQRQIFQSGFHNTCCSKDLDLKKFPKSDHLAKLDRGTFDKFCTDLTPS
ncbi:hypothetical protein KEM48_004210 [Puccinia striiformis f. sp. tritici PST-130]|nr:hypothetical protein KEM48_004210 [Puccinia striiformis f. sp. tritici PST-130]